MYEKKLGIANVRNAYLNFLEKKNFDFCSFLDDDCLINKNFFLNHLKFILYKKCQIVTGPQIYLSKRKFLNNKQRYKSIEWRTNSRKLTLPILEVFFHNNKFEKSLWKKIDLCFSKFGGGSF